MKFKLDENLPLELADDLTRLGHDADTVFSEGLAGSEDATVVQAAQSSERILMTLDIGIASLHHVSGTMRRRTVSPGRIRTAGRSVVYPGEA
jgi:predicted nuclease of predicted toxin-antitoxin system